MSGTLDKRLALDALIAKLSRDLEAVESSQRESQAGATHEEARPESDKDTRATESSYLARGLAKRVEELRANVAKLSVLKLREFAESDTVALSAMVIAERDSGDLSRYFVVPCAGGVKLEIDGCSLVSVTPSSPLGQALVGRQTGDELEARTPQGAIVLTIVEVS